MVSTKSSLGCCSMLVLLIVLIVEYSERSIRETNENAPIYDPIFFDNHTWKSIADDIPQCKRPVVFRNAFKYPSECRSKDQCNEVIINSLVKHFGDRLVQTIIPDGSRKAIHITLDEYINNPKYKNHSVHTLHGLAEYDEYHEFFKFNEATESNDFKHFLRKDNDHFFLGSQIFMNRGIHKGSQLHFALGQINIFTMLSGRKRWLMVSPFYSSKLNCSNLIDTFASNCAPDGYFPYFTNIDLDKYKNIMTNVTGVPEEYIVDVTLNPGDVLVNCVAWPHAVENLDEVTSAFSFRYQPKLFKRTTTWYNIIYILTSLRDAVYIKFTEPSKLTMLDAFYHTVLLGETGYIDSFLKGKTIVRQKGTKTDTSHQFDQK